MVKNKLEFISEIASTHNGKPEVIYKLIKQHLKTDSENLKLQILKSKNLFKEKTKLYNRFKKIEIDYTIWNNIINNYKNKTRLILEPFDTESFNFCLNYSKDLDIKISSSESDNFDMIKLANKKFSKIFINLSGYTQKQISYMMKKNILDKKKNILMYGYQSYPTKMEYLNFKNFDFFAINKFM